VNAGELQAVSRSWPCRRKNPVAKLRKVGNEVSGAVNAIQLPASRLFGVVEKLLIAFGSCKLTGQSHSTRSGRLISGKRFMVAFQKSDLAFFKFMVAIGNFDPTRSKFMVASGKFDPLSS